jgi:hypothetical protein
MLTELATIHILNQTTSLRPEDIRRHVRQASLALEGLHLLTEDDLNTAVQTLEEQYQTVIGEDQTLQGLDANWTPWLARRRAEIDWAFYSRYEKHLRSIGFPGPVIEGLGISTDKVLNLLGNPDQEGAWDRRGLVVGQVQSGKTAHYLGLINKAFDAGYKVVVIFTGFLESLRVQTQVRLDQSVTGAYLMPDPANPKNWKAIRVGVGKFPGIRLGDPESATTRQSDFRKSSVGIKSVGTIRQVFVMKKNVTLMKHLNNWIEGLGGQQSTADPTTSFVKEAPLLVIDDESDVGSIDTKKGDFDSDGNVDSDHDPSKVNGQLRRLLTRFERRTYVGYTATPFANVLIHDRASSDEYGEDLFPKSFIHALPAPSTHVGPGFVFGPIPKENLPIVRDINMVENGGWVPPKHKKTHVPRTHAKDELPPSLKQAIRVFILVCAARRLRTGPDSTDHNSMLIHVTRYVAVQEQIKEQVEFELKRIRDALTNRVNDAAILSELKELWNDDFVATTKAFRRRSEQIFQQPEHTWNEVKNVVNEAVGRIDVRGINGGAKDVLDYEDNPDGLYVIAIGGDKLSRGLTLEGLSISYFLRSSRMYDTLMQMGRWFGYRPGYPDLCRLYLPTELNQWFGTITAAAQELTEEFVRMQSAGATPKEYGLRVRSHPDLLVTSQVKMRHGEQRQVTFQGANTQTIHFRTDRQSVTQNWQAAQAILTNSTFHNGSAKKAPRNWNGYQRQNVEPAEILAFLDNYQGHKETAARTDYLSDYIKQEIKAGRLTSWAVGLVSGSRNPIKNHQIGPNQLQYVRRSWSSKLDDKSREDLRNAHAFQTGVLTEPKYEAMDLTREHYNTAFDNTQEEVRRWNRIHPNRKKKDPPTNASGSSIRNIRANTQGLMVLYPLDPAWAMKDSQDVTPLIGLQMSFPRVDGIQTLVTYTVNNVFQQEEQSMFDFNDPMDTTDV